MEFSSKGGYKGICSKNQEKEMKVNSEPNKRIL